MNVTYETMGDPYAYPEIMNTNTLQGFNVIIIKKVKSIQSCRKKVYIDGQNTMPLDSVVELTYFFIIGALFI